ncbi:MAG: hypothetical protein WC423_27615, partial [Vulcanimicrobiota bacterium]
LELDHGILFHSVSLSVVGLIVNNQWEALLYFTCRTPDLTITPSGLGLVLVSADGGLGFALLSSSASSLAMVQRYSAH